MEHYYSKKPQVESGRHTWTAKVADETFTFTTDAGVFSKTQIDAGSELLAKTAARTDLVAGKIIDMGCGYGPIGLYLAKKFPKRTVHMVDINERAVELSALNAIENGLEERTEIYQSSLFEEVEADDFALIVSNPPIRAGKKVVHEILERSYEHLLPGGQLQIVIQRKQGAPSAKKKMEEVFGNVDRIALEKGYWILRSIKN